jgi:hypothetical protein
MGRRNFQMKATVLENHSAAGVVKRSSQQDQKVTTDSYTIQVPLQVGEVGSFMMKVII